MFCGDSRGEDGGVGGWEEGGNTGIKRFGGYIFLILSM